MDKAAGYILAFAFVIFAAAQATAQSTPPGKGAEACALIAKTEIEQILDLKLQDSKKDPRMQRLGTLSSCDYATSAGGTFSILIGQTSTKYVAGSEKAEFEKRGLKLRYTQGLGNAAFFTDMSDMGTALSVFRGDYDYAMISAMGIGSNEKVSPALEKVARILLERWK